MAKSVTEEFTVDVDGKTYQCRRTVTGTRVLRQRITVDEIGTEPDGGKYGHNGYPVSRMDPYARTIAKSIIKKSREQSNDD
jgi:hypothetical protein